jgi:hypothetical protein
VSVSTYHSKKRPWRTQFSREEFLGRRKMWVSGMFLNSLLIFVRKDDYRFYVS